MALVFDQEPQKYTPVYNQSPWVVRETDTSGTLAESRMLCTVFSPMTNTDIGRFILRFRAGTERRVVFDPSTVVQGLISYDHGVLPGPSVVPWRLAPNSIHWYRISFQSQRLVNGVWVNVSLFTTENKCVFNGALPVYDFVNYDQNDYASRQNIIPVPLTSFIPNLTKIGSDESYWVHFLSADAQAPASFRLFRYTEPDLQGTPIGSVDFTNTFGSSFTGNPSIGGDQFTRPRVRVGIGPRDINNLTIASMVGVKSYLVIFRSQSGNPAQEISMSFNISDCNKYPPTRLHWLNEAGGFDAWTFGMKSHTEEDVDRKQFYSQKNTLTGGSYGYDTMSRGTTDYHIGLSEEITLNTDLLTDAELEHLRGLVSSPVVFREVAGGNGNYSSVNVVTKSWQQKRGTQDGTFNLEIKIKPSMDSMRQRG